MPIARDGCVVPTEPLTVLLGGFVREWHRHRPPTGGKFRQRQATPTVDPMGALQWLSEETRIPKDTIRNIAAGGRYRHTELRIADPLLAAIGRPDALRDGTLPVLPNPKATREAQAECCGGCTIPTFKPWSLTGA